MRVRSLSLHPGGFSAPSHISSCDSPFTVAQVPDGRLAEYAARSLSHILFGDSAGRAAMAEFSASSLGLVNLDGAFNLRRRDNGTDIGELVVETASGSSGNTEAVRRTLERLSPLVARSLYAVNFRYEAEPEKLLGRTFSRDFNAALDARQTGNPHARQELLQKRDALAHQIEQALSESRLRSGRLGEEIDQLEHQLTEVQSVASQLRDRLHGLDTAAGTANADVLRRELVERSGTLSEADAARLNRKAADLDTQIKACRNTISILEERRGELQRGLADTQTDNRSEAVAAVFQLRETISNAERVLDAIDKEIGQIATAVETDRPVDRASHSRLRPLSSMLREQLSTLGISVADQERAQEHLSLQTECKQLDKALAELADRLQLLLAQRESLTTPLHSRWTPQIQNPGEITTGSLTPNPMLSPNSEQSASIDSQRRQLYAELQSCEGRAADLEATLRKRYSQRAGLIGGSPLETLKAELGRVESRLSEIDLGTSSEQGSSLRASDLLSKLSAGELVQIRPLADGRAIEIINCHGERLSLEQLAPAQHHQLFLAMQLAMVDAYTAAGIELPVLLVSPFDRLDPLGCAALATVLGEFSRQGTQVIVFTPDARTAQECVANGGIARHLGEDAPQTETTITSQRLRVVRESRDGSVPFSETTDCASDASPDEVYYLTRQSEMHAFPVLGNGTGESFAAVGIHTIAQLLAADPTELSRQLNLPRITATTVRLWQTHTRLLCTIPGVTLADAQVLAACGFGRLEKLAGAKADDIRDRIDEVLATDEGQRFSRAAAYLTHDRISVWVRAANQAVAKGSAPSPAAKPEPAVAPTRKPIERKFFLSLDSPVEEAPAIGPKTADHLETVGIRSVADLLGADPASTAEELDIAHIRATQIAAWQHQARLVCRIPNLRGFGAQLLVACGYTDPEQIAGIDSSRLVKQIGEFCNSKAGKRILRGSSKPSDTRIADWVRFAAAARSLEAA